MCPLRFILVFFSAILAGYFAWRSYSCSDDDELNNSIFPEDFTAEKTASSKGDQQGRSFKMIIQDGFWVFVDMASGKYLWRNLKEMNMKTEEKVKNL
ncbi:uncharacterized protein LOC141642225 [Silene latifolia]|uniref:uncharacterized protein LOC141642225 n=1 Tax=Silene latifolia TaxID=37657 RepID=UPI003D77AA7A